MRGFSSPAPPDRRARRGDFLALAFGAGYVIARAGGFGQGGRVVPAGCMGRVLESPIVYSLLRGGFHPPHPLTAERGGAIVWRLPLGVCDCEGRWIWDRAGDAGV